MTGVTFSVLPIEHDLLMLARAALGVVPVRAVLPLLVRASDVDERSSLAAGLSASAKHALERTLAAGSARALLRRGGWRAEVLGAPGGVASRARFWERPMVPLHFTHASFELLRWLTLESVGARACPAASSGGELQMGDELLLYVVCDLLVSLELPLGALGARVGRSGLAQLAFPDALNDAQAQPERIRQLVDQPMLLTGLQEDLTRQLLRLEEAKSRCTQPNELEALSLRSSAGLSVLVQGALARGRGDQLRFLAAACTLLVERDGRHLQLDSRSTLRARQAARVAAAQVLRVATELAVWHGGLRHVGFVDDDFERAQALLSAWELYGPALERAGGVADSWSAVPHDIIRPDLGGPPPDAVTK